jgi:AraC family transcriptional regulator of adaptative response/methylated-DNA-[protein]-cysteine methyltransferase
METTQLSKNRITLRISKFNTVLGTMIAIGDDRALYLLEFDDKQGLEQELQTLCKNARADIIPGNTGPIDSIKAELQSYFNGTTTNFITPVQILGSQFQKCVWQELARIPYGQTKSYRDQAETIGNKKAYRAVASANASNRLAIIIPCHRVINSNGNLGGYSGGLARKEWLINHEKKHLAALIA